MAQALVHGDLVAARYRLIAQMHEGGTIATEIYLVGEFAADGRLRRPPRPPGRCARNRCAGTRRTPAALARRCRGRLMSRRRGTAGSGHLACLGGAT